MVIAGYKVGALSGSQPAGSEPEKEKERFLNAGM